MESLYLVCFIGPDSKPHRIFKTRKQQRLEFFRGHHLNGMAAFRSFFTQKFDPSPLCIMRRKSYRSLITQFFYSRNESNNKNWDAHEMHLPPNLDFGYLKVYGYRDLIGSQITTSNKKEVLWPQVPLKSGS